MPLIIKCLFKSKIRIRSFMKQNSPVSVHIQNFFAELALEWAL